MISKFGLVISQYVQRIVPDPFVIAILLTIVTAIVALIWGNFENSVDSSDQVSGRVIALLDSWRDGNSGIWKLLAFSMQMCLVLVTGYALATTRVVKTMINLLADVPRSTASAAALVGLVACCTGLLNWGLGLIVGALLAREVGFSMQRRQIPCHYPLIAAAGYMGLLVWHGGLSGSAPLSMTTHEGAAKILPEQYLAQIDPIVLSDTIGSSLNLLVNGGLIVLIPLMLALLAPKHSESIRPISHFGVDPGDADLSEDKPKSLPDRLNQSKVIAWFLGIPLLFALGRHMYVSGIERIGLNEITLFMLGVGILLHGSPIAYMRAVTTGAKGCGGIIIQFPLYAGIMAMMIAAGLMETVTEQFVEMGSQETIPLLTMISAGFINLFVPSGGGQWAIQAPIALSSGIQSGVAPGTMVMAVAYGDQLTNMLQPFWALPLLAITGVRARDIVGYTAIVMIAAGIWMAIGLLVMG